MRRMLDCAGAVDFKSKKKIIKYSYVRVRLIVPFSCHGQILWCAYIQHLLFFIK